MHLSLARTPGTEIPLHVVTEANRLFPDAGPGAALSPSPVNLDNVSTQLRISPVHVAALVSTPGHPPLHPVPHRHSASFSHNETIPSTQQQQQQQTLQAPSQDKQKQLDASHSRESSSDLDPAHRYSTSSDSLTLTHSQMRAHTPHNTQESAIVNGCETTSATENARVGASSTSSSHSTASATTACSASLATYTRHAATRNIRVRTHNERKVTRSLSSSRHPLKLGNTEDGRTEGRKEERAQTRSAVHVSLSTSYQFVFSLPADRAEKRQCSCHHHHELNRACRHA